LNWNSAKNFAIIFFIMLNAFLGGLTANEANRFNISEAQAKNISEVLYKNGIALNAAAPRSYRPVRLLTLSEYDYDMDGLLAIFFPDPDEVEYAKEQDRAVYRAGHVTLSVQNGYVLYENPRGGEPIVFEKDEAEALCAGLIEKTGLTGFALDGFEFDEYDRAFRFIYRQLYGGKTVYSNYFDFVVTDYGITQAEFIYGKPLGFNGAETEVYASDVALLSFMKRIAGYYGSMERHIDIYKIEMVFIRENDYSTAAAPYYRIFYEKNGEAFEELISAYNAHDYL